MATTEPVLRPQGKSYNTSQLCTAGQGSSVKGTADALKLDFADVVLRQAFSPSSLLELDETPCKP